MASAREIKKRLQLRLERGEFANRQALLDYGEAQGWTLWRNGQNYLTFGDETWDGNRKRARLKLNFGDEADFAKVKVRKDKANIFENPYLAKAFFAREPYSTSELDIRWIYVIFAQTETETAAYVGQASRISNRVKGHIRTKSLKSSGQLQSWAKDQGAALQFVIVGSICGILGKAEVTRRATHLEGFWTERARLNGVILPGVEGWGQFPPQPYDPDHAEKWLAAINAAIALEEVLAGTPDFERVCLKDADFEGVRSRFVKSRRDSYSAALLVDKAQSS